MSLSPYYTTLPNKTVKCTLCHHRCLINDNQKGVCGARENRGGRLYSLVYGYPAALNIDPVEKKPLFHFLPGSLTYSLGTPGCNLKCANCQNWNISQAKAEDENGRQKIAPEEIVNQAISAGCRSISYTYNEPTVFAEYALDIMKLARERGLKNIWVSNGYMSDECLDKILPRLDAANIDLKSMEEDFYRRNCAAELAPILDNLKRIKKHPVHLEITTLIIPSLSDDPKMLASLAEFIAEELGQDTPWHISRFFPDVSWKLKSLAPTDKEKIYLAYEIGKSAGLRYVYAGNLAGDKMENTYCPHCGGLAVERIGYGVKRFDQDGVCAQCKKGLSIMK